jgi:putative membrane protein
VDTELANDRTFLAWLRTGIALFGLGFVVAKFALLVQPDETRLQNKNLYSAVGVVIVLCGAALVVVGYLQHARVFRSLHRDKAAPQPRWPFTITVTAFVGSLVLSALVIVST